MPVHTALGPLNHCHGVLSFRYYARGELGSSDGIDVGSYSHRIHRILFDQEHLLYGPFQVPIFQTHRLYILPVVEA
ncbi:hypothetical protein D3C73_916120 [compost metagenome]